MVDASQEIYAEWNTAYSRNTCIANLLGICSISVPCGFTEAGLPVGLMITGKARGEAMVLRIAQAYEQATEWHRRRPALAWAGEAT